MGIGDNIVTYTVSFFKYVLEMLNRAIQEGWPKITLLYIRIYFFISLHNISTHFSEQYPIVLVFCVNVCRDDSKYWTPCHIKTIKQSDGSKSGE